MQSLHNCKCTTFSESPINFEFRHCWPLDQHVCSLKENSLLFLQGGLILVWSSFFATHTLWEVSAWEFLLQLGLVLCTGAWWFALGLVLCAGAWCKPLHHRFFHLRPINAPKQIACLCETFLGIIKLLWGSKVWVQNSHLDCSTARHHV